MDINKFLDFNKVENDMEEQDRSMMFINCLLPKYRNGAELFFIAHPDQRPKPKFDIADLFPNEPMAAPIRTMESEEATLTVCQAKAWGKIKTWLADDKQAFFVLKGPAGTGKSYLMRMLNEYGDQFTDKSLYFTAPTNKATGVLSDAIKGKARTIYSLLGIKMVQFEDEIKLEFPEVMKNMAQAVIVLDEASMTNEPLIKYLDKLVAKYKSLKILFVGDPYQLPPVGEKTSKAWKKAIKEYTVMMTTVKRFDSQLLVLATAIRNCIKNKDYDMEVVHEIKDGEQVRVLSERKFEKAILACADDPQKRIIAWRNKTVNSYNKAIRKHLGFKDEYVVGERIILASPIIGDDKQMIGAPDDEGIIQSIVETSYTRCDTPIQCFNMSIKFPFGTFKVLIPTKDGQGELETNLATLAVKAKSPKIDGKERSTLWGKFWSIRNAFVKLRYSYAMTAHRAQGSTFHTAFVDAEDILANRNKHEAFRCAYVGFSRPSSNLLIKL